MPQRKTKMGAGGRVVIPSEYRKALGLKIGDDVLLVLEDHGLRITTPAEAVTRAQALVRRYVGKGRSLSDELIKHRRGEAKRE